MTLDHGLTITRLLDAPRDLVFRAWTDPEQLRWFFSDGKGVGQNIEVDLRVGGSWRLLMVENEDKSYYTGGIYLEIVPNERLAFAWGATDGWPLLDPDHLENGPKVTITLNEVGDKTEMILRTDLPAGLTDDQAREWFALGIKDGWTQTLYRLLISFRMRVP